MRLFRSWPPFNCSHVIGTGAINLTLDHCSLDPPCLFFDVCAYLLLCLGFGSRCIDVGLGGRGVEGRGWGPRLPPPGPAGIVEAGHWPFPPKLREEWRVCIAQSWTPISHIAPGGDQGTHPFLHMAPRGKGDHLT